MAPSTASAQANRQTNKALTYVVVHHGSEHSFSTGCVGDGSQAVQRPHPLNGVLQRVVRQGDALWAVHLHLLRRPETHTHKHTHEAKAQIRQE